MTPVKHIPIVLIVSVMMLGACSSPEQGPPMSVSWQVVDNHLDGRFLSRLSITNTGTESLGNSGWTLYFNFLRPVITETVPPEIRIEHVNGDLVRLTPAESFAPLEPGQTRAFEFASEHWAINISDAPAGPYLVRQLADGRSEVVALGPMGVGPFAEPRQTDRGKGEQLPTWTPELEFARNQSLTKASVNQLSPVTPRPVSLRAGSGTVRIPDSVMIFHSAELQNEARLLADVLSNQLGAHPRLVDASPQGRMGITLRTGNVAIPGNTAVVAAESYRLSVEPQTGIVITGRTPSGVFYGTRSLLALIPTSAYESRSGSANLPIMEIVDGPRFPYRGMHLDVARNFQSKESVLKLLELMAFYKLNRFHFHLTDDEGWRLEIRDLPELTEVGGRRGHTESGLDHLQPSFGSGPDPATPHGSGHYSRSDYIEILQFAAARHIEVIPEIDVPGHARAAIKAMQARHSRLVSAGDQTGAEQYLLTHPDDRSEYMSVQHWTDNVIDVCMPSTYAFLRHVIDDIVSVYHEANAPLTAIHVGGDEVPNGVWLGSPACTPIIAPLGPRVDVKDHLTKRFIRNVSQILDEYGLTTAGWEEIAVTHGPAGAASRTIPNPEFAGSKFQPYVWNSVWGWGAEDLGYRLANAGYKIVMSNASNLYFDLAYAKDPLEPGYYWAGFVDTRQAFEFAPLNLFSSAVVDLMGRPISMDAYRNAARLNRTGRANVLGIQGQLWGENAKGAQMMEYLALPKLIGLAERAWSYERDWEKLSRGAQRQSSLDRDWKEFANRLGQFELPRLDHLFGGTGYRLPPPGAVINEGRLHANVAFPGLTIRYTMDGSEPNSGSSEYVRAVAASGTVHVRSFDTKGRGSRPVKVTTNSDS